MSHFTVLVVGDDYEKQLAPFQENNMGDCPEEYLEFNEIETEERKDYETGFSESYYSKPITITEKEKIVFETNGIVTATINIEFMTFFRKDDYVEINNDLFGKIIEISENTNSKKYTLTIIIVDPPIVRAHKERFISFETYMEEYCGHKKDKEIGQYGYWRNNRAKWDWYQIGGRWSGFFKIKPEYCENNSKIQVGEPGVFDNGPRFDADQCKKKHVDFKFMLQENKEESEIQWDLEYKIRKSVPNIDFKHLHDTLSDEEFEIRKKEYWAKIQTTAEELGKTWFYEFTSLPDESKKDYIERMSIPSTFAILKDGKWHEHGKMGWWGIVLGKEDDWHLTFKEIWDSINDEEILTVVDCHI